LSIPLACQRLPHQNVVRMSKPSSSRPRILLVEDEEAMRKVVAELLSDEFDVETAADGEQALVAVLRSRPDLVITDIVMPLLDGVELVRMLREAPSTSNIPVLLTSGRAPDELRIAGFEVGADSYLAKPYSGRELRARIRNMLQSHRRRDEAARLEALELVAAERAALLESITDSFCALDNQDRITYANQRAQDFFGRSRAELLGQNIWDVMPAVDNGELRDSFGRARLERCAVTLEVATHQDTWLEVHAFPGASGLALNFRDITDRKVSERRMKEAERRKDEFVATLAHELRNPLAPIRNGIHLLRTGTGGPAAARVLDMMDRQMKHLVRLLDDLLDLSRITRGRMELKREIVRMKDVLAAAIESTQTLVEARNHQLIVQMDEGDAQVFGDPTRLSQIFANLISNAAKYTEPGGRIGITLKCEQGECVVSVADNGIGIPPQALGQLFEMFSQVRLQQQHAEAGLGIGLSVVKTLVQMHGGEVSAFSDGPGSGSTFVVRLPLVTRSGMEVAPASPEAVQPAHAEKILVVDDNRDAAQTMAYLLQAEGHEVKTAFGGEEAVTRAAEFRPDLIFMDLGMPQVDGYEATRRIRAQSGDRRLRIIALTGWGQAADRQRASDAGMDGHLVKPADPDVLRKVICHRPGTDAQ
jgi:PAS domain S-box-containing protein